MSDTLDLGNNYFKDHDDSDPIVGGDITVVSDNPDLVNFDKDSNTTQIQLADGSVSISLGAPKLAKKTKDFNSNLAEELTESELSTISEKLLRGIESDIQSRASWLENVSNNISLLGLEIKQPRGATVAGATPAEGVSTVDHPLLLEAVLRFQANARGELLPTDGPVKVRNDGEANALSDRLAQALEKDLNHYLTKTAKEYYPDTDRMLLMLGFSGISFKKGYHDPIRRRPVIESIDAKDLIVSNAITNIDGAGRVTHSVKMRPSILRRMQLVGAYRDIALPQNSLPPLQNPVDAKISQLQGVAPPSYVDQDDIDRELYECYCEIEIPGFEHKLDGKETGLPLPYKVTVDKEARRILEIRRNWEEDDPLCMARNRIIAYIFIPGMGFYGIGLVNILGNATKAVTAAWRLMLDAGMFANFPGFLYVKSLAKQLTNQFRIPPGGGMPIDTVGGDIRASIMPLPYKDPSAVFIQLIENIASAAQRVGGTAELQVGEGKQDAPVGTTLAMVEQATKLISAVHKRLHQAQGQELDMLKSMLIEDPEALWRHRKKKSEVLKVLIHEAGLDSIEQAMEEGEQRHIQLFLAALDCCDLIPRADPNTSSQTERYLKVVAMRQMAMTNPGLDMNAIDHRALTVMGIDDPDDLFHPPAPPGQPQQDPHAIAAQANVMSAQARMADTQTKAQKTAADIQIDQLDIQNKTREIDAREKIAALGVARAMVVHKDQSDLAKNQLASDNVNQHADRSTGVYQQSADHSHGIALANLNNTANTNQSLGVAQNDAQSNLVDRQHDLLQDANDKDHELNVAQQQQGHEADQAEADRTHEAQQKQLDRTHQAKAAKIAAANKPKPVPQGKKKK